MVLAGLFTWPICLLLGGLAPIAGAALAVVSVTTLIVLMRVRAIGAGWCPRLLVVHLLQAMVAIGAADGGVRVLPLSVLVLVMSVFSGLFLVTRTLWVSLVVGLAALVLTLISTDDGRSLADGIVLFVFGMCLALMTSLTARTSQRAELVDADTGLPNARGMADALARRAHGEVVVVVTVHSRGVGEVRDALGHGAGRELVRRSVEDLGQVLPGSARIGRGADDDVVVLVPCEQSGSFEVETTVLTSVRQIQSAIGTGRYLVGTGRYLVGDVEVSLNAHVGVVIAGSHL